MPGKGKRHPRPKLHRGVAERICRPIVDDVVARTVLGSLLRETNPRQRVRGVHHQNNIRSVSYTHLTLPTICSV
eukprot:7450406-Lingulodinium_polyedra.AAC.1